MRTLQTRLPNTVEGFRNVKLGIAISVTSVFIFATSELEEINRDFAMIFA